MKKPPRKLIMIFLIILIIIALLGFLSLINFFTSRDFGLVLKKDSLYIVGSILGYLLFGYLLYFGIKKCIYSLKLRY